MSSCTPTSTSVTMTRGIRYSNFSYPSPFWWDSCLYPYAFPGLEILDPRQQGRLPSGQTNMFSGLCHFQQYLWLNLGVSLRSYQRSRVSQSNAEWVENIRLFVQSHTVMGYSSRNARACKQVNLVSFMTTQNTM